MLNILRLKLKILRVNFNKTQLADNFLFIWKVLCWSLPLKSFLLAWYTILGLSHFSWLNPILLQYWLITDISGFSSMICEYIILSHKTHFTISPLYSWTGRYISVSIVAFYQNVQREDLFCFSLSSVESLSLVMVIVLKKHHTGRPPSLAVRTFVACYFL